MVRYGIICLQVKIVSAHRTPEMMYTYATSAHSRGVQVIIAGAGGAAHLPGMSLTCMNSSCHLPQDCYCKTKDFLGN